MYDNLIKEDQKTVSAPKPAVQVHYNSPRPAQLHANAYTRGNQVYLGAGQEHCLPHELGHVLQQQQRSVPITEKRNGMGVNTDTHLEQEADRLGAGIGSQTELSMQVSADTHSEAASPVSASSSAPVQMNDDGWGAPNAFYNYQLARPFPPQISGQFFAANSNNRDRAFMSNMLGWRGPAAAPAAAPAPAPAAAPAPAPAPAAAPAAQSRQSTIDDFCQLDAQWRTNRQMPAAFTSHFRPKPQLQQPAKASIGTRLKNLFKRFGKKFSRSK